MEANPLLIGRFAPTPSGRMHLGNIWTALIGWLAVRSSGGKFLLRIEDLDPRARKKETSDQLIDDLLWLGLDWDKAPIYQSQRTYLYRAALKRLEAARLTYPCFCTRTELHAAEAPHTSDGTYIYQGTCRNLTQKEIQRRMKTQRPAIRLKVPAISDPCGKFEVRDLVYGLHTEILARDCGDFLICRSDGIFSYQLAVVVDDGLSGVNLIVRGHDLLGSTGRQTYLARLLGFRPPRYAHVPLLIAADGKRLSKREHDFDLGALRNAGVSPEHIIGTLAWKMGFNTRGLDARPADLINSFSWEILRTNRQDIVVNKDFLDKLGIAASPMSGV
jgi:glutamyl-tRNA synthetase